MFFHDLVVLICRAGAEVKVGEPLLVSPGEEKILHLSQVSSVSLFVDMFIRNCRTVIELYNFHRHALESPRAKEVNRFSYMSRLAIKSLFWDHYPQKNSHKWLLIWCLTKILSYLIIGKMEVSTLRDIHLSFQKNILSLNS